MAETVAIPQGQSKTEVTSGMDRLETESVTPVTEKTEPAEPVTEPVAEPEKTEPVTTEPANTETVAAVPATEVPEEGFKDDGVSTDEGTWKATIEALGYQTPTDYSEEKGFEVLQQLKEAEINAKVQEVLSFKETDIYSSLPEQTRAEAQFTLELMKAGVTLDEIYAPTQQIKEWKGMSKEGLIRLNIEKTPGITQDVVDHRMEALTADPAKLDLEYKSLMLGIDAYEKDINVQRQAQIKHFNESQAQIKEQKRQQDFHSMKAALDKMPTFMDRKLSDENKKTILNDYQSGAFENITAAEKAEFMVYRKYGKQGLEYIQSRAIEKATLEKAKTQHNVPLTTAGGTRVETTTHKTGMDRLTAS